jgi:probable rRNA maturation factor
LGHGTQEEIALYVVHGLLHLCGYDDRTEKKRRAMRERENSYMKELADVG